MQPVPIFVFLDSNQQPDYAPEPPHSGCGKKGHPIIWISLGKPGFTVEFPCESPFGGPWREHADGIFLKSPKAVRAGVFDYTLTFDDGASADPQIEVEDGALSFLLFNKISLGIGFAAGVTCCLIKDQLCRKR